MEIHLISKEWGDQIKTDLVVFSLLSKAIKPALEGRTRHMVELDSSSTL
jgi:hypothetical protein